MHFSSSREYFTISSLPPTVHIIYFPIIRVLSRPSSVSIEERLLQNWNWPFLRYMYMCTLSCIYMHVVLHTCAWLYMHVACDSACMCLYACVYTCTCMCLYMHVALHASDSTCMWLYSHTCMYIFLSFRLYPVILLLSILLKSFLLECTSMTVSLVMTS